MAGATIEVKYFNTFVLKKTVSENTPSDQPLWNGSFGIPTACLLYTSPSPRD